MNTEQLTDKLVAWIHDRVLTARCEGVVVGVSGGLDSSVTAVLCHRALPQGMLAVFMPCYSSQEDEEHAQLLARTFSIPIKTVSLNTAYDALLSVLPGGGVEPEASRLAQANIKARLRMLTLYYCANGLNYLVAGSSNRGELTTGYFTKYGDGGVDIMPLGNLVKEQVRGLAHFLDVPQVIIDKPPSGGLWVGQTDEGELGLSYDEIDRYLITGTASDEVRQKIESRLAASKHKCLTPPIPNF